VPIEQADREVKPVEPEPGERTLILRALSKSGLLDKLFTWGAVALVGGTATVATKRVSDAQEIAELARLKLEVATLSAEFKKFKDDYWDRQRENRVKAEADHKELEREQRAAERYLERRLTRIESRVGIEAPPAPAEESP
jgi:hypothetical protein